MSSRINIVTGAFGFTGAAITRRLLAMGEEVRTLTGHPRRSEEFGDRVKAYPFNFDKPELLAKDLEGGEVLYNTYWIRFEHSGLTFDQAVANSNTLIKAAEDAGIKRIVHVSITNPSAESGLPYFSGKAEVEKAIVGSRLSHAILRPAVIFGDQGILINNIAWFLRRLPVFGIPGSGEYKLQPIFVDDLAELAVDCGRKDENAVVDAIGPETFTFNEMVRLIRRSIRSRTLLAHLPGSLALLATGILGRLVGDVVLTRDEVEGLEQNLLLTDSMPAGRTHLTDWLRENAGWLGRRYFSEVKKHF